MGASWLLKIFFGSQWLIFRCQITTFFGRHFFIILARSQRKYFLIAGHVFYKLDGWLTEQLDVWMHGQINGRTDGRTNRRMAG